MATTVNAATASQGSQLVQVTTFPLVKPYTDKLFGKVTRELTTRVQSVAHELGGKITHVKTATPAHIRSHSYEVTAGHNVFDYTFVLRGTREYQLLCKRPASSDAAACGALLTSFAPR